jgi:hypothetical protein
MGQVDRIVDRNFFLLMLAAGLATVMDIESTVHAQRDPEAAEFNSWIYGERPGRPLMYAINLPVTATLTRLAYTLKKQYSGGPSQWAWSVPLMAMAVGHGAAAIANYFNFPRPTMTRPPADSERVL